MIRQPFGKTGDGYSVESYTLASGDLEMSVMTFGATWLSLKHRGDDLCLGYDTLEPYLGDHPYFGSTVGRVAGRIVDGTFEVDGERFRLKKNNPPEAPVNHLHGGSQAWSHVVWEAEAGDDFVSFSHVSPDGDNGYPGRVEIRVTYKLDGEGVSIDYEATTDRATPLAPTNHAYFNLLGHNGGPIGQHVVQIHADENTPVDEHYRFLGKRASVDGTVDDLRQPTKVGDVLARDPMWHGSMYFVDGTPGTLRPAATVLHEQAKRRLDVSTTETCLQFYTGFMLENEAGKHGMTYGRNDGLCLEAQAHPDAAQPGLRADFGKLLLRPEETYRQTTRYALASL
jgi:aldose 1-epimerase